MNDETAPFGAGPAAAAPYLVLARKYRPSNFDDLIGQEPMVRTLTNAFALNRIHQAYILTGVRGVGKTTTARILARAFNYEVPGGADRPSIVMPELGRHCQAIIESRHIDVIEMDAASHTGIDDVREIIESARYRPTMARSKIFIIDEVHMLSKAAFNGLLKTLEEPPEHVKFLFATTEIEKVPVTVRSRCQRFDLRRIEPERMVAHLAGICRKEDVTIAPDALGLIARAAEGSVRDALSLLDQAIAQGGRNSAIDAGLVQTMLGLADRARIIDMFEALLAGRIAEALGILRSLHDSGADPLHVLTELAEFVHLVTRLKLVPEAAKDAILTPDERDRGQAAASSLSLAVLVRSWQILLKGIDETRGAARPLACAEMVLVRLGYAADLPSPDEALRRLTEGTTRTPMPNPSGGGGGNGGARAMGAASPMARVAQVEAGPERHFASFADVVAEAGRARDIRLKTALETSVKLVRFEQGRIEFEPGPQAAPDLAQTLMARLTQWTGQRWMVSLSKTGGAPTLREQVEAREARKAQEGSGEPLVQRLLERFPGAKIIAVRGAGEAPGDAPSGAPLPGGDEIAYADDLTNTDDD
ncbi:MAG: DNA polymerase III subunit gamma/tau [Hyphomicrobiales bacterium]|nr:DNA polymerase III subunit gamma/tau [Hyphomicrobiales bacterium]